VRSPVGAVRRFAVVQPSAAPLGGLRRRGRPHLQHAPAGEPSRIASTSGPRPRWADLMGRARTEASARTAGCGEPITRSRCDRRCPRRPPPAPRGRVGTCRRGRWPVLLSGCGSMCCMQGAAAPRRGSAVRAAHAGDGSGVGRANQRRTRPWSKMGRWWCACSVTTTTAI